MKKLVLGLALVAFAGYVAWTKLQPPPPKLTDAFDRAKKENKMVLLDFTGSDWCEWCMKLDADVLGQPEFLDYASKYLVTVVVDFPRQHELPGDVKRANAELRSKYNVSGFPTLVALSPDGKEVWRQDGYAPGGPFTVIAPLNRNRMAMGLEPVGAATSTIAATTPKPAPAQYGRSSSSQVAAATSAATPVTQGLPADAPKLQGILYSRSNPSVFLGGQQCHEGDTVGGMRVVKIQRNSVMVEWQGQTTELTME